MKKAVIMIFCLAFLFSMVNSGDFKYVGVKKCKMCHKGERKGSVYEKWMERAHAKAFETLKKEGQEKNPKCLACFFIGYGIGNSWIRLGFNILTDFIFPVTGNCKT